MTSPTFTIGHRYRGRIDVSHLDLFRFSGLAREWGDLEPYFEEPWSSSSGPRPGSGRCPPLRMAVRIEHAGGDRRTIELAAEEGALLEGIT